MRLTAFGAITHTGAHIQRASSLGETMKSLICALIAALASTVAHAQTLSTQDYVEIEQLYARYNHAIDSGDAAGWAATFTADGKFQQFTGTEALKGFVKNWVEQRNGAYLRHWNSNLHITPSADGASGTVMLMLLNVGARPAAIAATGMYSDKLVKTPEGWRFAARTVKIDAPAPTAEPKTAQKPDQASGQK